MQPNKYLIKHIPQDNCSEIELFQVAPVVNEAPEEEDQSSTSECSSPPALSPPREVDDSDVDEGTCNQFPPDLSINPTHHGKTDLQQLSCIFCQTSFIMCHFVDRAEEFFRFGYGKNEPCRQCSC